MHVNETFMTSDSLTSEKQSSAAALTLFEFILRPHDYFFYFACGSKVSQHNFLLSDLLSFCFPDGSQDGDQVTSFVVLWLFKVSA